MNRVGKTADFGRKLACRLLINRVRVLGSGPHTPTHFFGSTPPRDEIELVLYFTQNVNVINISYSRCPGLASGC